MADHERDLIGYGANPPHAQWPGGARIAVNFLMNFEEGGEPSVQDGDGYSETLLTELGVMSTGIRGRDLCAEDMFAYGTRVAFWRLMRLLSDRGIRVSINGTALALERHPEAARALGAAGHDICGHGYRWLKQYDMPEEEEREQIRKAVASITRTVGERPYGWNCRYGPSLNTRRLLAEEGGFLYDSDSYDDELPYWTKVQGNPYLVVPYTHTTNDTKFGLGVMTTGNDFFEFCRDAFDVLYREGATVPKMMSIGLHMRIIGQPARVGGLEKFLDYIQSKPDVWITRRVDIARHWRAVHPYRG
jgi:peptidoglycan/xylan/chitin deacetylase (PgdA/CDA1 family)